MKLDCRAQVGAKIQPSLLTPSLVPMRLPTVSQWHQWWPS